MRVRGEVSLGLVSNDRGVRERSRAGRGKGERERGRGRGRDRQMDRGIGGHGMGDVLGGRMGGKGRGRS